MTDIELKWITIYSGGAKKFEWQSATYVSYTIYTLATDSLQALKPHFTDFSVLLPPDYYYQLILDLH